MTHFLHFMKWHTAFFVFSVAGWLLASSGRASEGWRYGRHELVKQFNASPPTLEAPAPSGVANRMSTSGESLAPAAQYGTHTTGDYAETITPEIQALAIALGNDSTRIFSFVYDNIRYEHYFGCRKGAQLTFLERSGNDMDQSALLVALLRAAGFEADYKMSYKLVPYHDETETYANMPDTPTAVNWLGLDPNPLPEEPALSRPPDWTVERARRWLNLSTYVNVGGFPYGADLDKPDIIHMLRVTVRLTLNDETTLYLDPAAKRMHRITTPDFLAASGFSEDTLLNSVGGNIQTMVIQGSPRVYSATNLDQHEIFGAITRACSNLLTYIKEHHHGNTTSSLLGEGEIVPYEAARGQSIDPLLDSQDAPQYFINIPRAFMSTLTLRLDDQLPLVLYFPQMQGGVLSVAPEGAQAVLRLNDQLLASTSGYAETFTITIDIGHHIYQDNILSSAYNYVDSTGSTQSKTTAAAITYGFSVSHQRLKAEEDQYRLTLATTDTSTPLGTRKILTCSLNIVGLRWHYQMNSLSRLHTGVIDYNKTLIFGLGRFMQDASGFLSMDIGHLFPYYYPKNGVAKGGEVYLTSALIGSALEHGILEQQNGQAQTALSTIRCLDSANDQRDKIFWLTSETAPVVLPQLRGYGARLSSITEGLAAGKTYYLPRWYRQDVALNPLKIWGGYIEMGGGYIAMLIGEISGGGNCFIMPIDYDDMLASFNGPLIAYDGILGNLVSPVSTPGVVFPIIAESDPVDMANGAFIHEKTDLSLGLSGTRGLEFTRYYNSLRSATDEAKIGFGWTHNYNIKLSQHTNPASTFGIAQPEDAAFSIAAFVIMNELLAGVDTDLRRMVTGIKVANYTINGILNNVVALTIGKHSLQFVRQFETTYTSPPGLDWTLQLHGDLLALVQPNDKTYYFNSFQDGAYVTDIVDVFGLSMSFEYNSDGLYQVTDAYDRTLTFTYFDERLHTVTDSTGRSVTYTHVGGNLTASVDVENKMTRYGYDAPHLLNELNDSADRLVVRNHYESAGVVDYQETFGESDQKWQFSYDGYVHGASNPDEKTRYTTFDERGRPLAFTDASGHSSRHEYDGQDRLVAVSAPDGGVTRFQYDKNHHLIRREDPLGLITKFDFEERRLRFVTQQDTDPQTPDRVTEFQYDVGPPFPLPSRIISPDGVVNRRTYHGDGSLWKSTIETANGDRTTVYNDYENGLPRLITYPGGATERFTYTARGDVKTHLNRRNYETIYEYNNRRQVRSITQAGNEVTEFTYDDAGDPDEIIDPLDRVVRLEHDALGRLLKRTLAPDTDDEAVWRYESDTNGRLQYSFDPEDRRIEHRYWDNGWLKEVEDPAARVTAYEYDSLGRISSVRPPLGYDYDTHSGYDLAGRLEWEQDPSENRTDYSYNGFNQLKYITNRRQHTYEFTYDNAGRPEKTITPLGFFVKRKLDEFGRIETLTRASGDTDFVYDTAGWLDTLTDAVGIIDVTPDENGNSQRIDETIGDNTSSITRTFDALERVETYTNARNQTVAYEYHANGLLWKLRYPGDRKVIYEYYENNRLKSVTDWDGRITRYFWDKSGRLLRLERPNNVNREHRYDASGWLERIFERGPMGELLLYFKFGYDYNGRITSRYRLPKASMIDPVNNFTATYDGDNRLETWNALDIVHDDDGNMTNGPLGASGLVDFAYDARNRLITTAAAMPEQVSYAYDAENHRVSMTTSEGTTHYLIDPHAGGLPRVLVRERPDGTTTSYVYGVGLLYEMDDSTGSVLFYHFDQVGSTAILTNGDGEVTDRVEYDPYGAVTSRVGSNVTPFLYVGEYGVQQDPNGLLYMRARYYSPQTRRFVNADPIGFGGGLNWYAYANGNPVMFSDPTGNYSMAYADALAASYAKDGANMVVPGYSGFNPGAPKTYTTSNLAYHSLIFGPGYNDKVDLTNFYKEHNPGALDSLLSSTTSAVQNSIKAGINPATISGTTNFATDDRDANWYPSAIGSSGYAVHNFNPNYTSGSWTAEVKIYEGFGAQGNEIHSNPLILGFQWLAGALPRNYTTASYGISGYIPISGNRVSNFNNRK